MSTDVLGSRPSARIIVDVPPLPEPRDFGLTEINVQGATALFLEWESPKGEHCRFAVDEIGRFFYPFDTQHHV